MTHNVKALLLWLAVLLVAPPYCQTACYAFVSYLSKLTAFIISFNAVSEIKLLTSQSLST